MMTKKKKAVILLVLAGVGTVCLLGGLATVAVPNFIKYRYKSKQSEAQYMLKVLLTKQQEFRGARGHWAMTPRDLVEFVNSAPRSSTCFLGPGKGWGGKGPEVKFEQLPPAVRDRLSANERNPEADLVIACAVNLDEDEALDVWTISASAPTPRIDFADRGE